MGRALHLLKGDDGALALPVIARQLRERDAVIVVLLHEAPDPGLPEGVTVRRLPEELTYGQLLDLIFECDPVITW